MSRMTPVEYTMVGCVALVVAILLYAAIVGHSHKTCIEWYKDSRYDVCHSDGEKEVCHPSRGACLRFEGDK